MKLKPMPKGVRGLLKLELRDKKNAGKMYRMAKKQGGKEPETDIKKMMYKGKC